MTGTVSTWLICAQPKRCSHAKSFNHLGLVSWKMEKNFRFHVGDIIYVYMSQGYIRFKAEVEAEDTEREDLDYWKETEKENVKNDRCYRLRLIAEYNNDGRLNGEILKRFGFKGGGAIQHPKRLDYDIELKKHIESTFERNSIPKNLGKLSPQ
ncbi:hypothetical protein E5358_01625 [Palleniella muris]|uniref:Uncharacterized protein n=1 Tax=Palleniella muris TaxID=3038145 RepID=A0AC61QTZ0_9BACT|nr:hypothetical protein [Palleniella muris]TGX83900.1 hypothetical protein E5358_01625 [Palleniella muris]